MIVGVPKEIKADENRVALLPFAVERLTNLGCKVVIENNAEEVEMFENTKRKSNQNGVLKLSIMKKNEL